MSKPTFPNATHDFHKSNGGEFGTVNREPSLTRAEFAEECDINQLMKRYDGHVTGGPGNLAPAVPIYLDWTEMPQDLMGYLNFIQAAEQSFMALPAVVRKEFDNSAIDFVAFASDPENLGQMREWGLAPPAKAPDAPAAAPSAALAPAPAAPPAPAAGASTHGST